MTGQSLTLTALGKYTLIASLAEGGMAKVYLGLMAGPAGFNKLLVIKVLNRDDAAHRDEDNLQLFWDEARLAARVIHPNVVHTYEVGEIDGRYFLAMEYLDGQAYRTLQIRMQKDGLPPCEELRIIAETARGLHYAHELKGFKGEPLGVVHRDVSPQNVFITYDGQVKLLDFGIAKSDDSGHKTQVGVIKGKLDYIAPEQLSGDKVDARADIFSLGAMLWEALSGRRFAGGRAVAEVKKVHARVTGGEPKLRVIAPDVPEELVRIVDRAIALDPQQRWADAGAMADALDAYIVSTGHRPGAKALSEAMNRLFADERRIMHKLIEQQIEANAEHPVSATTGILPHLASSYTMTRSGAPDPDISIAPSAIGSVATIAAPPPKPVASNMRLIVAVLAGAAATAATAAALLLFAPQTPRPVATVVAPASAMLEKAVPSQAPRQGNDSPNALAPSPDGVEAQGKATVLISLRATPADARVTLDSSEVAVPFSGEFRRGGEAHNLEATAKGYEPFRKLISFNSDQSIDIVLQTAHGKRRRPGVRAAEPAAPIPVAGLPTPVAPAPVAKPAPGADLDFVKPAADPSEIDTANPFAKKP